MGVEVAQTDMTVAEVGSALMKLGLLREGIEGQLTKYVEVVAALYHRRAWIADGTGSWEAFATKHDVPVELPRGDRQTVSVALGLGGLEYSGDRGHAKRLTAADS